MNQLSIIRATAAVLFAAGLWGLSVPAHSLSCMGFEDRFFMQCSNGSCTTKFRARDIPAPGACARRIVVEDVHADVAEVLLHRLSNELGSGIYEVTLVHRYYADPPVSAQELSQAFAADQFRAPRVHVGQPAVGSSLDQLREDWVRRAWWSLWALFTHWAFEFALVAGGMYVLYRTTAIFLQRLRLARPASLAGPIALQAGFFALTILCLGFIAGPVLPGMMVLVIPPLWVYELGAYFWARHRSRSANEFF
jgi:hypothetical protein